MPRGIGRATALTLAQEGCDVVVTGFNNMDGAKAVSDEIKAMGRRSLALKMNGRDYSGVQKTFATIKKELGPVKVLVNNVAQMRRMMNIAKTTMERLGKRGEALPQLRLLLHQGGVGGHVRQQVGRL